MMKSILPVVSLIWILFLGCKPEKQEPVPADEYFYLKSGRSIVYQVTEVRYAASIPDSLVTTWQERDEIVRVTKIVEGGEQYTFARSRRNTALESWQKVKEYSVTHFPEKNLLSLDNLITVTAVFPISYNTTWNTNLHNDNGTETSSYEDIGASIKIGALEFPKTITVLGRNITDDDVVGFNLALNRYAAGVGLIYERQTDYLYSQEPDDFGLRVIATGLSTIREVIDYQNN